MTSIRAMLFPLRLTPFEEYMLIDNHPVYPMSCFLMLKLRGTFDVLRFESALQKVLPNHPLLTCLVSETANGHLFWQPAEEPIKVLRHHLGANHSFPPSAGVDLFCEPALKVTICNEKEDDSEKILYGQTNVVFEIHHSACDAAGSVRFLEDIFYEYAAPNETSPAVPVKPILLLHRETFGLTWTKILRTLPKRIWGFVRAWKFFMNRIVPLVAQTPKMNGTKPPAGYPAIIHHDLTLPETRTIRQKAEQSGMTVNDLLLCAAFFAMKNWQEKNVAEKQNGFLRIAVPTNLRIPEDRLMPAANIVSMVFIDRKTNDIQDAKAFYQGVHKEMQHIKRCNLGLAFITGLTVYQRIIGSFRRLIRRDRCWATATVSNIGRVFDGVTLPKKEGRIQLDGNLELLGLGSSPPIRPWTALGICVTTYADCMTINLHYDSDMLNEADAEYLLNDIRRSLS